MGPTEIEAFLSHLAVEGKVSASTQNQAFNAILFLYRHVLDVSLEGARIDAVRAHKKRNLPVVLTKEEVKKVITLMTYSMHTSSQHVKGASLEDAIRPSCHPAKRVEKISRPLLMVIGPGGDALL